MTADTLPPLHWPIEVASSPFAPALLQEGALGWALSSAIALTALVGTRATLWMISGALSWLQRGEWSGRLFMPGSRRAWSYAILAAGTIGLLVYSQGPLLLIALREMMLPIFLLMLCWDLGRAMLPGAFTFRHALTGMARRAQELFSAACGLDLAILGLETVGVHLA